LENIVGPFYCILRHDRQFNCLSGNIFGLKLKDNPMTNITITIDEPKQNQRQGHDQEPDQQNQTPGQRNPQQSGQPSTDKPAQQK
jgi:hypothetical protein